MAQSAIDSSSFIIRLQSLSSGTDVLTHTFGREDLQRVAGGVDLALTTATSTTSVACTQLGTTNTYLGRIVEFLSGANSGLKRTITSYVVSSGTMGFNALPATPQVGDKFKILSPVRPGCSVVGFVCLGSHNASNGDLIKATFQITNSSGKRFGFQATMGTGTPFFTVSGPSVPVLFELIDGNNGDITVTVTNGTWSSVNDYYFHFVSS